MENLNNNNNPLTDEKEGKCHCGDDCKNSNECKCKKDCKCTKKYKKCDICKCYWLLPIVACMVSVITLIQTYNKPIVSNNIDENKIRSTVIDIIKNDPQILIDAMSAGIVRQRTEMTKQQALDVNKYQKEIISASYTLGNTNSKKEIICFFDPICSGCIDFQKTMVKSLRKKKDICFHILPVAALGEHSEEITKIYHTVYAKEQNKFISFIEAITQDVSDVDKALTSINFDKNNIQKFVSTVKHKMSENIEWLEKLRITSVPCIFTKSENGKFVAVSENELIEVLGA